MTNPTSRPNLLKVGQRIKRAREALGLSQEKFGEFVNKNQRTISNIERGTMRLFLDDLYLFAETLDKPVTYFLEDDIEDDDLDTMLMREIRQLPNKETKQMILQVIQTITPFLDSKT